MDAQDRLSQILTLARDRINFGVRSFDQVNFDHVIFDHVKYRALVSSSLISDQIPFFIALIFTLVAAAVANLRAKYLNVLFL